MKFVEREGVQIASANPRRLGGGRLSALGREDNPLHAERPAPTGVVALPAMVRCHFSHPVFSVSWVPVFLILFKAASSLLNG